MKIFICDKDQRALVSLKNQSLDPKIIKNRKHLELFNKIRSDEIGSDKGDCLDSIKSVSIIDKEDEDYEYISLHKVSKDMFHLQIQHPLTPLQAFAFILTRFDAQLKWLLEFRNQQAYDCDIWIRFNENISMEQVTVKRSYWGNTKDYLIKKWGGDNVAFMLWFLGAIFFIISFLYPNENNVNPLGTSLTRGFSFFFFNGLALYWKPIIAHISLSP